MRTGATRAGTETRYAAAMLIDVPSGFDFRRTVLSHGWSSLAPFSLDRDTWTLRYGRLTISADGAGVRVVGSRRRADAATVAHVLHLDADLAEFYDLCASSGPGRRGPDLRWVPAAGAGRLLRSPTVFEDLVKLLATTNCSWALTERMCNALVEAGGGAFPAPDVVAALGVEGLRARSFGYRAAAAHEIARRVADGEVDPQTWLDPDHGDARVRAEILALPGCGPYVADNMCKLVDRYDGLGLDSWVRAKLARLVGRHLDDRRIARRYTRFGRWRGLALWCEVTADWIPRHDPSTDAGR